MTEEIDVEAFKKKMGYNTDKEYEERKAYWNDPIYVVRLGAKIAWQKYPCITAYSKEYALIADSKDIGKIVDIEGSTIDDGFPVILGEKYNISSIADPRFFMTEDEKQLWDFWHSKYPDLLPSPDESGDGD
ncbi:MAG: hypothetical protein LBT46_09040 [Planctomycetaceae bacterium]|jgi:hypothetical protein|nr:hypothetical protein [Planctomycetaceae bacterium]